jgi:4-amino-4-deoxy-L-arabinose transferase-like glycosyltransferase
LCGLSISVTDALWLSGIIALAFSIRTAWILYVQSIPISDFAWYDERAWGIASGLGYVDGNGSATAYRPVGYPAFLAAIYKLFGHSWVAGQVANAILGAIIVLFTYVVATRITSSIRARMSALVVAFSPSHIAYSSVLGTEMLFTTRILLVLILTLRHTESPSKSGILLLGVALGMAWLVRGTMMLFPVVLLILFVQSGRTVGKSAGHVALVVAVAFLVGIPWTMRNSIVFDTPVLVSTNGGVNFWIGNGPGATGAYRELPDADPLGNLHQ